jgi:hypothetical protein
MTVVLPLYGVGGGKGGSEDRVGDDSLVGGFGHAAP